ncbi:MAG TPA: hypothetical protein PK821_04465, partial [Victivallales bacterium]|nr:hypothetical protein [Victivallales bacterium]
MKKIALISCVLLSLSLPILSFGAGSLSYSSGVFAESGQNIGMVDNGIPVNLTLSGDSFNAGVDEDLVLTNKVSVTNLPDGMNASIKTTGSNNATIEIWGTAENHDNSDDISDLTISFNDSAFTGGNAASITDSTRNDLVIDFFGITVSSNADSGAGSLRQAIADAEAGETIGFISDMSVITLSSEITISKSINIEAMCPDDVIISGNNTCRIFKITASSDIEVYLAGITLKNGSAQDGAAIYIDGADSSAKTVYIDNCVIKDNNATRYGAAIFADASSEKMTQLVI